MSTTTHRSRGSANELCNIGPHELELIDQLGLHVSRLWEYDRQLADPDSPPESREFWRAARSYERDVIDQLKARIDRCSEQDGRGPSCGK